MAALTVQSLTKAGITPNYTAATAAAGDTWPADDRTFLVVKNGGGSSVNVTIPSFVPDTDGAAHVDKVVAVAAGSEKWIPVPAASYGDPANGGIAKAVCSAVTSVTVAAIRLP